MCRGRAPIGATRGISGTGRPFCARSRPAHVRERPVIVPRAGPPGLGRGVCDWRTAEPEGRRSGGPARVVRPRPDHHGRHNAKTSSSSTRTARTILGHSSIGSLHIAAVDMITASFRRRVLRAQTVETADGKAPRPHGGLCCAAQRLHGGRPADSLETWHRPGAGPRPRGAAAGRTGRFAAGASSPSPRMGAARRSATVAHQIGRLHPSGGDGYRPARRGVVLARAP